MTQTRRSPEYIQHYKQGPFVGRIDPWAEVGRYFQQIHSGMIDHLQEQLQDQLIALDYQAGREASLQIFANHQPDLYIQRVQPPAQPKTKWDYDSAASGLMLEPGTMIVDEEPELEALHITDANTGDLVTVIEIISPRNKTHLMEVSLYKEQCERVFLNAGVNVVEIDATRSIRRLLNHALVNNHPYHIAIYLPDELPRVLVNELEKPLKPFALPLRAEVIPVYPHEAFERAYQRGAIAGLIQTETGYSEDALPFPSLLTDNQREEALHQVKIWQTELERLKL